MCEPAFAEVTAGKVYVPAALAAGMFGWKPDFYSNFNPVIQQCILTALVFA